MTEIRFNRRRLLLATTATVMTAALPKNPSRAANGQGNDNGQGNGNGAMGGKGKLKTRGPKPFEIQDYDRNPFLRPVGPALTPGEQARLRSSVRETNGNAAD